MSTWHQDQARVRLYHATEWTVVEDPHNGLRTLSTFTTQAKANEYCDRVKALRPQVSAYVLRPAKEQR